MSHARTAAPPTRPDTTKEKILDIRLNIKDSRLVGVTGFEPATTRPPDVYSNRTELRPDPFPERNERFSFRPFAVLLPFFFRSGLQI